MPKKVTSTRKAERRKKRSAPPPVITDMPAAAKPAVSARPPLQAGPVARRETRRIATLDSEDYSYIYADLKRIGILTGGIFAILAVLTFILR